MNAQSRKDQKRIMAACQGQARAITRLKLERRNMERQLMRNFAMIQRTCRSSGQREETLRHMNDRIAIRKQCNELDKQINFLQQRSSKLESFKRLLTTAHTLEESNKSIKELFSDASLMKIINAYDVSSQFNAGISGVVNFVSGAIGEISEIDAEGEKEQRQIVQGELDALQSRMLEDAFESGSFNLDVNSIDKLVDDVCNRTAQAVPATPQIQVAQRPVDVMGAETAVRDPSLV